MNKILVLFFFTFKVGLTLGQSKCDLCAEKFKVKDFVGAKPLCILAAKDGDPICQSRLGIIYLSESDSDNAKIWFEKSANQGNPSGQNGLGYLYQQGDGGLPKDLAKANYWFLKSAQQGDSDSQFWLGENLFLSGNKSEGYKWTLKASLNGSSDAQYNLGAMLQNGEGTAKDETLAIIWFIISATNENERSKRIVDNLQQKVSAEKFREYIKKAEGFIKQNPQAIK